MRVFDHMGIPTQVPQPGERLVQATKTWVTDPKLHPFQVEWLRYQEGSPVPPILKNSPHIAFRVDDIAKESAGLEVILPPFPSVAGHVVGFYKTPDGAIVELMVYGV